MPWTIDWLHQKAVHISPYMYEGKIRKAFKTSSLRIVNEKDKPSQFYFEAMVNTSPRILGNLFYEIGKPLNCTLRRKYYDLSICNVSV